MGCICLLTRVDVPGVSGLEGVEWDAVELPSQFMENFCWEWDVVEQMSAHVDTGEPLPQSTVRPHARRQEFPERHADGAATRIRAVRHASALRRRPVSLAAGARTGRSDSRSRRRAPPRYDRSLPHAFSHVFAGGYAAGYYSYKWAEVLSADAYELVRGARCAFARPPVPGSATKSWPGRQPAGAGLICRISGPSTPNQMHYCGIMVC